MPAARKKSVSSPKKKAPTARASSSRQPAASGTAKPLSLAVRSLRQVTEALQYAHQSFADAQLKLPRPEDFEPLLVPLREFARVSPALVEAFRGVIQTPRALVPAPRPELAGARAALDAGRVEEARRHVDAAREALRQALDGLPRDADYRPVAAQLRELASVSPSLLDWLKGVPKLTTPLSGSVAALRRAALDLEAASDLLAEDVPAPAPTPRPR